MNEYLKIAREHIKKGNDPELLEYWDHLTRFNEYELNRMNNRLELNDLKKEILKLQEQIERLEIQLNQYFLHAIPPMMSGGKWVKLDEE